MNVLLIHVFLERCYLFCRLQNCWNLWATGVSPLLYIRDARQGISDLANQRAEFADQNLPADSSSVLVGFSMGCSVAKYYLESGQGSHRIRA